MANPFVHVELSTTNLDKAKKFYAGLFDWKLEDVPMGAMGTYTTITVDGGVGGGMMNHPMPGQPSFWLAYVNVDDIKVATEKVKSLGGTIIRDVTPVADLGWLSILTDPTGAALGLWQQQKKA